MYNVFVSRWRAMLILGMCSAMLAILFVVLSKFPHVGYVNELTVSGGILVDANKMRDMVFVPLAIIVQLIIISTYSFLYPSRLMDDADWLKPLLIFISVVALTWSGRSYLLITSVSVCCSLYFNSLVWKDEWQQVSGWLFLIAVAATSVICHATGASPFWTFAVLVPILALIASSLGRIALVALGAVGAVSIAVMLFLHAPYFWQKPIGVISLIDGLFAVLSLIIVAQALNVSGRFLLSGRDKKIPTPPYFTMALGLSVVSLPWYYPAILVTDDYHFGESLLAYQALIDGNGWFVSFLSPHGFSDALNGMLASLMGDDSGPGIVVVMALLTRLISVIVFWRILARLGPVNGLLIGAVIPQSTSALFILLVLLLVVEAATIRRAWIAGALSALLGAGGIFLYAGPATAAALAGGVGGLIVQAMRSRQSALRFVGGSILAAAAVLILFWPEVQGQLNFLKVSAASNLTIYGNGDFSVFLAYPQNLIFAFAPLLAIIFASWTELNRETTSLSRFTMIAAVVIPVAVLVLLLNTYAMARLDTSAARAEIASAVVLAFLPLWLVSFSNKLWGSTLVAGACSLMVMVVTPPVTNILSGDPISLPASAPSLPSISATLPHLGAGHFDQQHVQRIETVARTVNTMLDPGETFLNLTNRNSYYYYLERAIPVPIPSTYNAAPAAFQKEFIAALGDVPPPLALVSIDNQEHDGMSLPLRAHAIYDYVITHYVPFLRDGYIFAVRRDLADRLNRLPSQTLALQLLPVSDANWQGGVAIGANAEAWSFAVDRETARLLKIGDTLLFSDGIERHILKIEGMNVLAQPAIPVPEKGNESKLGFTVTNRKLSISEAELWSQAFHRQDLSIIPSSWGRSMSRLASAMKSESVALELVQTHGVRQISTRADEYETDGGLAQFIIRPKTEIDPRRMGILQISVSCMDKAVPLVLKVQWRKNVANFSEDDSVAFVAHYKFNIVPLDASPRWTLSPDIYEMRIDIDNPHQCRKIQLRDIQLLERE